MTLLERISNKGTKALKELRKQKLKNGFPFMINSVELETNQCYLEYPNGSFYLYTLIASGKELERTRELTPLEISSIKKQFQVSKH